MSTEGPAQTGARHDGSTAEDARSAILNALRSPKHVSGLTHGFYRYPAAFSPELVRALILQYSEPGDLVLDPFSGGGTSAVESLALGRRSAAIDINTLAAFVGRVKTRPLSSNGWNVLRAWARGLAMSVDEARESVDLPGDVGNVVAAAMNQVDRLPTGAVRSAGRCAVLRLGQWALESCHEPPDTERCLAKLEAIVSAMECGMQSLVESAAAAGIRKSEIVSSRRVAVGSSDTPAPYESVLERNENATMVLTSPPYPRVHVLYSRWQVNSRREIALPYDIAGCRDGSPPSYYTMGPRTDVGEAQYFRRMEATFSHVYSSLRPGGILAQVVGFNRVETQLDRYVGLLSTTGFEQVDLSGIERQVPNRRWYARGAGSDSGREYLLVHRKPG